jgi:hypothetical protein
MRRQERIVPADAPYLPPRLSNEVAYAIRGLNAGQADASQQTLAFRWIIHELCKTYDLPYRPDSVRDTDFASGQQHCGQQLVRIVNMTNEAVAKLPKMRPEGDREDDEMNDT